MSYITHTRDGSFCDVCGATLGQEEIEFDCCDACGGEGIGGEEDEPLSDEQLAWLQASKTAPSPQGGKP